MPILPGDSGMLAATAQFPRGAKYKPPTHRNKLDLIEEKWPDSQFHAMREHGGQVFTEALVE
ncbi:MAG: hypothetical protein O2844_02905 [Proteobacteria bacterium]|nr:hypothetical protein [Pseudomonadota bacterium]MDA1187086.1 hypothetical protein [Pseudomonadota bacterium]